MKLAQGQGNLRLVQMLGQIRDVSPTRWQAESEECVICHDGECDGACLGAMYVVRQVLEALDSPASAAWWLEHFGHIDGSWRGEAKPPEDGAPCCPDPGCGGNPCTFPGYAENH